MTEDEESAHLLSFLAPDGWKIEIFEGSEALASASEGLCISREDLRQPARTRLFTSLKRRFLTTRRYLPEVTEDQKPSFLQTLEETRQLWNGLSSLGSVPDLDAAAPDLAGEDDPG